MMCRKAWRSGDFNRDGQIDVAVSGFYGSVYLFPGKGDGSFGSVVTIKFNVTGAGLAPGDLDGDGNPDLLLGGGFSQSTISLNVFVAYGHGDLTFETPVPLLADEAPNGIDFNSDGRMDIVSANLFADDASVLINNGNRSFARQILYGVGKGPVVAAAADLNGDQRTDILVVNQTFGDVSVLLHTRR